MTNISITNNSLSTKAGNNSKTIGTLNLQEMEPLLEL